MRRTALDRVHFDPRQIEALFAAVLIDDEIDHGLQLPRRMQFDFHQAVLIDCFRLARQLWIDGLDIRWLRSASTALRREHDLAEASRLRFKHIRARFKHLRYAHALYNEQPRYPVLLNRVTITMGQVQDAQRHGRFRAASLRAALLRALLTTPAVALLRAESDRLRPISPAAFRGLLERDYADLSALLEPKTVNGHQFHRARKVVGRQVSFWDTLRTLQPTEERHRASRWLSAINGSMGQLHDELVRCRAVDAASYRASFVLPTDMRELIASFVSLRP